MMNKKLIYGILTIVALLIVGTGLFVYLKKQAPVSPFTPFTKECAKEGEVAKADEGIVCCGNLKPFQNHDVYYGPFTDANGKEFYKEEPDCIVLGRSIDAHHVCINCGDGICGIGENKCNCPQDCDLAGCISEGGTLFPNDGNKCCAGLRDEWNYEMLEDGDCKDIQGALGHQLICVKCRDDICGKGENGCNCPQDCKDFKCKAHGEIPRYTAFGDDMSIQCCEGLKHRAQKDYFDEDCKEEPVAGYTGICLACGDRKCDSRYESKCNCPEDCQLEYFPPQPTQQEREDAKKLPKEQCPCWDSINNICLPQADCI